MKNNVDPDQLAPMKPADQDLHCFQKRVYNFEKSYVHNALIRWKMVLVRPSGKRVDMYVF